MATSFSISSVSNAADLPQGTAAGDMNLSPFYRWSGYLSDTGGTLLKEEAFTTQQDMPAAKESVRILYSSTDARWDSGEVPVSAALFLPLGEPPAEGWPLLAWAHGTLGIADVCAPSWTGFRDRDAVYLNSWLEQGFAVVATDYQGLGGLGPHPYSVWQAEGRSVLDSIRAAQAARPNIISTRSFIAGQSQGGGAALGAATLASVYAPELDILGAIVSGPNTTFPDGPVDLSVRDTDTIFLRLASGGLKSGALPLVSILTEKGLQLLSVARKGCTRDIRLKARELAVGSFSDVLAISLQDLQSMSISTTDMQGTSIGFPLLIASGKSDRTITPIRQYAVAAALCAAGNNVVWLLLEGMGHDGAMHASLADAFSFANARLAGETPLSNCADIQPPGPPSERDPKAIFNDD
tara:strand:- start:41480 stop:42706 length:1227 start_codon:yes stop_codon:yes gene_type:complete